MCLLIIGGVVVAIFLLDYLFKPKLDFPMPSFRLPIFGHMFFIGKKPHQKFESWGAECGSTYMIQVLNKAVIVVNDNMVFQQICDNGNFEARNKSVRHNILSCVEKYGTPQDIFARDVNTKHEELKKFTLNMVGRMRESSFFPELVTHTQHVLSEEIDRDSKDHVVDPYDIVTRAIYNHYLCAANGAILSPDSQTSSKVVQSAQLIRICMSRVGANLEMFPWLKYFGNSTYTGLKEVTAILTDVFRDLKKQVDDNGPNNGVASGYLTAPDRPQEPEDVMVALLVKDFIGAAEPAVTSFYGIIMVLADHSEIQEKLREEIFSRKLKSPFIPAKDCQSPYTEAFLMECLRYLGSVPMFIRRALKDTTINGLAVPKETNVIINLYAGHHDKAVWSDPWVIRPERFLNSDGDLLPESHPVRQHFKAYGENKKMCLGVPVVKDVLFSLILSMVNMFDISAVPGIDIPHDPRSWVGMALAAIPARATMKFTPRQ